MEKRHSRYQRQQSPSDRHAQAGDQRPASLTIRRQKHVVNPVRDTFPSLADLGYNNYTWIDPGRDENHAGYFSITGVDLDPVILTVDSSMLGKTVSATAKDYNEADPTTETTTTFPLPRIPIGSEFRWSYWIGAWIYKVGQRYVRIALDTGVVTRYLEDMDQDRTLEAALLDLRLHEQTQTDALMAALKLKMTLNSYGLNIVTAESLTSGMIAKMLTDIPRYGGNVYGGFVVYDTDAKRKFLGVKTTGVYSHATAAQMALGALEASRAMVSVSVTGNAMTTPEEVEHMGEVYIGVALRTDPVRYGTTRVDLCKLGIKKLCDAWKRLHTERENGQYVYAPAQMTSQLADYIRLQTVRAACDYTTRVIKAVMDQGPVLQNLRQESWDAKCLPSWIIDKHLDKENGEVAKIECDHYSDRNI